MLFIFLDQIMRSYTDNTWSFIKYLSFWNVCQSILTRYRHRCYF